MAFISGKNGSVTVGGTEYAFSSWRFAIKTKAIPVNNFTSDGFQEVIPGFTAGQLTIVGPYNQGAMAIQSGNEYDFVLEFTSGVSLSVTALVENLEPIVDAEDAERVQVTAQSDGEFSIAIA